MGDTEEILELPSNEEIFVTNGTRGEPHPRTGQLPLSLGWPNPKASGAFWGGRRWRGVGQSFYTGLSKEKVQCNWKVGLHLYAHGGAQCAISVKRPLSREGGVSIGDVSGKRLTWTCSGNVVAFGKLFWASFSHRNAWVSGGKQFLTSKLFKCEPQLLLSRLWRWPSAAGSFEGWSARGELHTVYIWLQAGFTCCLLSGPPMQIFNGCSWIQWSLLLCFSPVSCKLPFSGKNLVFYEVEVVLVSRHQQTMGKAE